MGHFHDARGELARAARWYQRAIDAAANHASGYIFLGGVLARQGRLREAEKVHRQATETCDEGCIDEAFLNLALVLRAQERFDEAAACLREALRIDPEYGDAGKVLRDVERCQRRLRRHRLNGRWNGD
jgi:tetratricopeptide (TPR) repeat protein